MKWKQYFICFSWMVPKLHRPSWRLHWIREETNWSHRPTCSQSGNISERNKKTSMFYQHSNMFNKKQWDFHPVLLFWMQVTTFLLQSCKGNKYYLLKSPSLKRRSLKNIKMKVMKNQMPKQQVMNEIETILYLLFLNVS